MRIVSAGGKEEKKFNNMPFKLALNNCYFRSTR